MRTIRAARIEAEKHAHVMVITDNGETWVRDTNTRAVYRNLTGTPALYVNGKQSSPQDWEIDLYRYRLAGNGRSVAAKPAATLLAPPAAVVNLLAELDSIQRCLIVGPSNSGKTTLLQWLVYRRQHTSKVVVFDPHGWPDKWAGCHVIGAGRNYADIGRGLAALLQVMNNRYDEIGRGVVREGTHPGITILIDEWRAIVANLGKSAADTIKALLTESRKAAFSVFVVSHSDRAKPLGLEGEYDLKDGFAMVRLEIVNGQRQATIDTGSGPQPALLPGPNPPTPARASDIQLDITTPTPNQIESDVLQRHANGESYSAIARAVFGSDGGNQIAKVKSILAKFTGRNP